MSSCAIQNCRNHNSTGNKEAGILYFTFPKDLAIRKKWVVSCRRLLKFNVDHARVCSVHFADNDYEHSFGPELTGQTARRVLKKEAVPHLLLPGDSVQHHPPLPSPAAETLDVQKIRKRVLARLAKFESIAKRPRTSFVNELAELTGAEAEPEVGLSLASDVVAENEHLKSDVEDLQNQVKDLTVLLKESRKQELLQKAVKQQYFKELKDLKEIHSKCENQRVREVQKVLGKVNIFSPGVIHLLMSGNQKTFWTDKDIASALKLRSVSKKAYTYLRKSCSIPLPSTATLKKWTSPMDEQAAATESGAQLSRDSTDESDESHSEPDTNSDHCGILQNN